MPNITLYLRKDEYLKLCNRAEHQHTSETILAKKYIEKGLKDEV